MQILIQRHNVLEVEVFHVRRIDHKPPANFERSRTNDNREHNESKIMLKRVKCQQDLIIIEEKLPIINLSNRFRVASFLVEAVMENC